ncbi:hypothetical protein UlMin_032628 [Ulmus minor]
MIRVVARRAVRSLINQRSFNHHISMAASRPLGSCSEFDVFFWRRRMAVMMMSTNSSSPEKATALIEEDRRERYVIREEANKGESSIMVSSYWGILRSKTYRADLSIDLSKHHVPKTFIDKFAYRMVKLLRIPTDLRYGYRAMMLETIAAILGIFGGVLLHLRSLRKFQQSGGWIKALLEEAENERMHLMTMVECVQLKCLFQRLLCALSTLSEAHTHGGWLSRRGSIHSYTEYLKDLNDGKIKNVPAPAIAIDYWKLPRDAILKDVITVICTDEAHHQDVNHFAYDIHYQGKELREAPAPLGYH